jgi:hypothetical protein
MGADSGNMGICRPIADQTRPLFHRTLLRPPIGTADWRLPNAATAAPDPGLRPGRAGRLRLTCLLSLFSTRSISFVFLGSLDAHRWENYASMDITVQPSSDDVKNAFRFMWESPNCQSQDAISFTALCHGVWKLRGGIRPRHEPMETRPSPANHAFSHHNPRKPSAKALDRHVPAKDLRDPR